MIPVHQTQAGARGNCMSAAIASILEIPLESVPNFYDAGDTEAHWCKALNDWLASKGLGLLCVSVRHNQGALIDYAGYAIASGPSPRQSSIWHAVVWKDGSIVHDPHRSGEGLPEIHTLEFFYLLDPSETPRKQ